MSRLRFYELKLFDTSDVTLKTLRACNTSKARTYTWPGVYLHVIYDPHNVGVLGLYVGSSVKVVARIKIGAIFDSLYAHDIRR